MDNPRLKELDEKTAKATEILPYLQEQGEGVSDYLLEAGDELLSDNVREVTYNLVNSVFTLVDVVAEMRAMLVKATEREAPVNFLASKAYQRFVRARNQLIIMNKLVQAGAETQKTYDKLNDEVNRLEKHWLELNEELIKKP